MAKFDEKYKTLVPYVLTEESVIRAEEEGHCFICGEKTTFLDPDSSLYFCSEECLTSRQPNGEIEEKNDQPPTV